jgi:hypothetical protein
MEVNGKLYINDLSPSSRAKSGFPVEKPEDPKEPDYKDMVSKVKARLKKVDVPASGGGKYVIQLRQLVKDLSSIVDQK